MGDHGSSFQEIPRGLQYYSNFLVFVVGEFWSKFPDILLSAFVTIWELRIILTWVYAEIASLVSPAIPGSFEIVSKNLAAAIRDAEAPLHCEYCSVSFCVFDGVSPKHNSHLVFLEGFCQARRSSSDRGPSNLRRELFVHPSSPDGRLLTLISLSLHPTLEMSSIDSIISPPRLWHLQSFLSSNWPDAPSHREKLPNYPSSGDVVRMLSLHFPACSDSNHLEEFFCHRSIPQRFLCCGLLLAVWHILLPLLWCILFLLFLGQYLPSFIPYTVWSLVVVIDVRRSFHSPTCILQEVLYVGSGIL